MALSICLRVEMECDRSSLRRMSADDASWFRPPPLRLAEAATPIGRDADEIDLDPRYQRPSLHNPSIHIDIL
jgi:hypothetical protein